MVGVNPEEVTQFIRQIIEVHRGIIIHRDKFIHINITSPRSTNDNHQIEDLIIVVNQLGAKPAGLTIIIIEVEANIGKAEVAASQATLRDIIMNGIHTEGLL
jgi:hypothetical protein